MKQTLLLLLLQLMVVVTKRRAIKFTSNLTNQTKSNQTLHEQNENDMLEKALLNELNLEKRPNPVDRTKLALQWYVQETLIKMTEKNTRFGEKVDAIKFSNSLGYSKEEDTYRLYYKFDLSGMERYKEIFGHDLYFRAPTKILKHHGEPAMFNVTVWEAGRFLNSSIIAPVSGNDYKIVIDCLSDTLEEFLRRRSLHILVDLGCAVHGLLDPKPEQSNASIATYGYMPPRRSRHDHWRRTRLHRIKRDAESVDECCTLHQLQMKQSDERYLLKLTKHERVIEPQVMYSHYCKMNPEYKNTYKVCRTTTVAKEVSVVIRDNKRKTEELRSIQTKVAKGCYCK